MGFSGAWFADEEHWLGGFEIAAFGQGRMRDAGMCGDCAKSNSSSVFIRGRCASKFAVVEIVEKSDMRAAAAFLEALVEAVLTDNGIQFADLPKNRQGPTARLRGHLFDRFCLVHGIDPSSAGTKHLLQLLLLFPILNSATYCMFILIPSNSFLAHFIAYLSHPIFFTWSYNL